MSTPTTTPVEPGDLAAEAIRAAHRQPQPAPAVEADEEPIPAMQRVLDNPFLLLFIGVTVPTVFYIIWGVMEIVSIPMAR